MHLVKQKNLSDYNVNDIVLAQINTFSKPEDEFLVCQKWLRDSLAKRYIYDALYGEYFNVEQSFKILDVGGGLTSLTRQLASKQDYSLVDLLAHDDNEIANIMMSESGKHFISVSDWVNIKEESYDVVIANDIFPNVDQRLELFLTTFLPQTHRLRLSLTYYDDPRYYMTRRIDADEVFCMLAWDGRHLRSVLERFAENIVSANMEIFDQKNMSVYPNGRQVCLIEFRGNAGSNE